jgi:hypothetical protein
MATLNIAAIRAASTTPQTHEITLPDGSTAVIRRLSYGEIVEAGNKATARERNLLAFHLAVVDPPLTPEDVAALIDDPALLPVAGALGDAINAWNRTTQPAAEVIKAEHAAFRLRPDEPDAPDGAGPIPV